MLLNKLDQLEAEIARLTADNKQLRDRLPDNQKVPPSDTKGQSDLQMLSKVISVVPNVIYVFNQATMVNEYSNKEIAATLGYSEAEIQAMGNGLFPALCHPDDLPQVMDHFAAIQSLADGEVLKLEYRMRHKNGNYRWLLSFDSVFERDASQAVVKHIGSASDITELKHTQTKLFQVNEELENFTYIASHDLKIPLINIESILILLKGIPEMVQIDTMGLLKMLDKSVDQGKKILNNLMFIAQTNLEASVSTCDLEKIAHSTIGDLGFSLQPAPNTVTTDFSTVPTIRYNAAHLESIFSNLLSNALKFRNPNGRLRIHMEAHVSNDLVCIAFQDNGLGIDLEKDLKKVFGLFQRAHNVGEGNGTGLYLVQKMLEANGGHIEVESQPGKGSTFKVFLKPRT